MATTTGARSGARPHTLRRLRHRHPGRCLRLGALVAGLVLAAAATACTPEHHAAPGTAPPVGLRPVPAGGLTDTGELASAADMLPPDRSSPLWAAVGFHVDPRSRATTAAVWSRSRAGNWDRRPVPPSRRGRDEAMASVVATGYGRLAFGTVGTGEAADAAVWRLAADTTPSAPIVLARRGQQWITAAAAGRRGVVAVGADRRAGRSTTLMWSSRDGRRWRATGARRHPPFDASGSETVWAVAAGPGGFVAVGTDGVGPEVDGAVWASANGSRWRRVAAPALAGPGRQLVQSVTYAGGRFVAGGAVGPVGGQALPVVWTSADGRTWTGPSAPLDTTHAGWRTASDIVVDALTGDGRGGVLATSRALRAAWSSRDGARWVPLAPTYDPWAYGRDSSLLGAAFDGTTTLALLDAPVVLRLDGDRWADDRAPMTTFTAVTSLAGLARFHGDLVAVGDDHVAARSPARRDRPRLWRWHPGTPWPGGGVPPTFGDDPVGVVASGPAGLVVAGTHALEDTTGPPDAPVVWTSGDGSRWRRIDVPGRPDVNTTITAAATLGDGYVVVGGEYVPGAGGGTITPLAIVSRARGAPVVERPRPPVGGRLTTATGACADAPIAVAVGDGEIGDRSRPVAWRRGPDGTWSLPEVLDDSAAGVRAEAGWATACADGVGGYLVVGGRSSEAGEADVTAWTSADGLDWRPLSSRTFGGRGNQVATTVVAVPGGGFLIGGSDDRHGDRDLALWYVDDNGRVTRADPRDRTVRLPHDQSIDALAVIGSRVFVAGDDLGRAGLWQSSTLLPGLVPS